MDWVNRTKPAYLEDIDKYPIPLPADILEPLVKTKGGNRMNRFAYNSIQTHSEYVDGKKTEVTEAITIRNGKGTKTVKKCKGNKVSKKTIPLTNNEIKNVQTRKFIPSLFDKCHDHCDLQIGWDNAHKNLYRDTKHNPLFHISKTRKVKRRTKKHTK
jgi:hypothetical protein